MVEELILELVQVEWPAQGPVAELVQLVQELIRGL